MYGIKLLYILLLLINFSCDSISTSKLSNSKETKVIDIYIYDDQYNCVDSFNVDDYYRSGDEIILYKNNSKIIMKNIKFKLVVTNE